MRRIGFIQPDEDEDLQESVPGYAEAIASEDDFWDGFWSWLITTHLNFFQVYGLITAAKGVIEYFRG